MKEGYLPLYRKYRPQKLSDIVGQTHIKRALSNAIELKKISHAYLFTGPRGTGKTSTARILAKSLNCIKGPTLTPCEECESCKSITNTIPIDVVELDAASNRSVDDARDILGKVNYAPVHGKYKIYIIDEVHMLTKEAFNALLKTLEEPPQNVIFILATTEAHKVPDTIISRCQRFDFKRITTFDIIEHLKDIAQKENIKITDGAISLIAKSSSGGMRDSLALLDQASTLGSAEEITENDINNLLGRLSFSLLAEFAQHIINSDIVSAINSLEKIYNDGNEPAQIMTNLMFFFKNMLIIKSCDMNLLPELTGMTQEQIGKLKNIVSDLEIHQLVSLVNKTAYYIKELKFTTNQQLWLEVGIIDLANLAENTHLYELEERIARLEGGETVINTKIKPNENSSKVINNVVKLQVKNNTKIVEKTDLPNVVEKQEETVESTNTVHNEVKPTINQISENETDFSQYKDLNKLWDRILETLLQDNISGLAQMKAMSMLVKFEPDEIVIACNTPRFTENLNAPDKRKKLLEAMYSVTGKNDAKVTIRVKNEDEKNNTPKIKPQQPKPTAIPKDIPQQEEGDIDEATNNFDESISAEVIQPASIKDEALSEQANMVKTIFDGKVLE